MVQYTIMLVMTPPQSGPESDRGHHGGGFGDGASATMATAAGVMAVPHRDQQIGAHDNRR